MEVSTAERERLASFRRVAKQVREASIIAEGRELRLHTFPGAPGFMDIYLELLGHEAFRSLALALRLTYQQREPAQFFTICNIVARAGTEPMKPIVADIRARYSAALADPDNAVRVERNGEVKSFSTQQVFDTWMYGIAFHQDPERQADVQLLATEGPWFMHSVQATSLQLAGRILDLDDVLADWLAEPRLPRIGSDSA